MSRWLTQVASDVSQGIPPNLGVVPGFSLTGDVAKDDPRWKYLEFAEQTLTQVRSHGLMRDAEPIGPQPVGLQFLSDRHNRRVCINSEITGFCQNSELVRVA